MFLTSFENQFQTLSGFGTDGNTVGSAISLTDLTLLGNEALVIKV